MLKLTFVSVFAFPVMCFAQFCAAPPEISDALKLSGLPAMLEQYPNDLWVHRAHQDASRQGQVYRQAVIDEYRGLLEKHAGEPEYFYLYGRALVGTKTPDAIAAFEQAIAKNERFAPPHLSLVEIYRAPNFRNNEKAREHLETWMRLCPERLDGFPNLERMEGSEFVRREVARMRNLLEARSDKEALAQYRILWRLEFQTSPANEYGQVKERIRHDLIKLTAVDRADNPSLAATLREGYQLIGDSAGAASAAAAGSSENAIKAFSEWQTSHPYPKPDAKGVFDQNATRERNKALLDASASWIKNWPEDQFAWSQRIMALQMNREAVSDAEVESAAEGIKRTKKTNNGTSSPLFQVASIYMSRAMHLSTIPDLIEEGLKDLEKAPPSAGMQSDLYPAGQFSNPVIMQATNINYGYGLLADAYLRTDQPDRAVEALSKMRKNLDDKRPADSSPDQEKRMWASSEATYWDKMGQIAERKGHKLDALADYQNEIRSQAMQGNSDFVRRKAKVLWTDLGGTEAAWNTFMGKADAPKSAAAIAALQDWEQKNTVMPAFEIADLQGKTWHVTDIKGKTTLVNLWATWCGPCREELPHLQKLYDKWKDRADFQVITLNTDDNPGLIEGFMKEKHYTFPVLPARAYVDVLVPSLSIPRNWIVNRDGVLKLEAIGFSNIAEEVWMEKIAGKMKETK